MKSIPQKKSIINQNDNDTQQNKNKGGNAKFVNNRASSTVQRQIQSSIIQASLNRKNTRVSNSNTPVLQRQIIGNVYDYLRGNKDYDYLTKNAQGKNKVILEYLQSKLDRLHAQYRMRMDADEIAEAIRIHGLTKKGIDQAIYSIIRVYEDHLDHNVLEGGHTGERHYAKDEEYQKERMENEHKSQVTTVDDNKAARFFFKGVEETIIENTKEALDSIAQLLSEEIYERSDFSKAKLKNYLARLTNFSKTFKDYNISFEQITPKGANGGGATIKISLKLTSNEDYHKTEYSQKEDKFSKSNSMSPIVMYWGRNSPVLEVTPGDLELGDNWDSNGNYFVIKNLIAGIVKRPITAF